MPRKKVRKIVIAGCGNLAWHIASRLSQDKDLLLEVHNHRPSARLSVFRKIGCVTQDNLKNIPQDAWLYFLCVPDHALAQVASHITGKTGLVLVCSGSAMLESIPSARKAALYPLQTFSAKDRINWKEVPLLAEGGSKSVLTELKKAAHLFGGPVQEVSYAQRLQAHIAAVFANNFSNALFGVAAELLGKEQLSFALLQPIILKTAEKVRTMSPADAQTGPALRNDTEVMEKHLRKLRDKRHKKVYKQISKLIREQQTRHA